MRVGKLATCFAIAGLLTLGVLPVAAQSLSDQMIIKQFGFTVNITTVPEIPAIEGVDKVWSFDHTSANGAAYGLPTILLEGAAGGLNPGNISDIFGVSRVDQNGNFNPNGGNYVSFISDPINNINQDLTYFGWIGGIQAYFVAHPEMFLVESPTPYDLTAARGGTLSYLNTAAGYSGTFASDVEVPDGGLTVALLGFAIVGVEGLRRKLRK